MGDTESVDIEHAGLLDADTIPNANQSLSCFSCGESMSGVFCHACGNKNDDYRRSIWSLGIELFSSLTAFEGRIWRSLRSLIFKPGQMAREFSDGARQKWTSPIRLYLAMSLFLFGYVAVSQTQLVAVGTTTDPNSMFQAGGENWDFSPTLFFLERKSTIKASVTDEAISAFENEMKSIIADEPKGSIEELEDTLDVMRKNLVRLDDQFENPPLFGNEDKIRNTRDGIRNKILKWEKELQNQLENRESEIKIKTGTEVDTKDKVITDPALGIENTDDKTKNDSNIKVSNTSGETFNLDSEGIRKAVSIGLRQPERINAPINKYLPRIMFFMMPFSMLIGAIFIRGREKAMLFDHLVHAAYIHAFSFLLLFIFILLVQFTPIKGLIWIYTAILLIYLPISAKRMFGRGWFKTFLTSYGVGLIYTFNMMIILTFLIGMGVSDIAKDVGTITPS